MAKPVVIKKTCTCYPIDGSPTLEEYLYLQKYYSNGTVQLVPIGLLNFISEETGKKIYETCEMAKRVTPACQPDVKLSEEFYYKIQ